MDIPLEDEDSSDEEYRPDEEDEDETAEEVGEKDFCQSFDTFLSQWFCRDCVCVCVCMVDPSGK